MPDTTQTVAHVNDLQDGQATQVSVGDTDVLLARIDGAYHALGAHCVHYGAPLADGVLSGKTIICPWHHAVYDLTTGEHLEPPGRDCLTKFEVSVDGDDVVVTVPEGASEQRMPDFCEFDRKDTRDFGIVGAGAAASMAAETLRRAGYTGKITMLTYEDDAPYDRPNLSKAYLAGEGDADWLPLRPQEFYAEHGISLVFGRRVERVDVRERRVVFDDGEARQFDKLLLATGGVPRRLDIPGADADKVFLLRTIADADRIIEAADAANRAVVIGSSFIGMEVAASLTHRDVDVSVATIDKTPFEKSLGAEVGRYFLNLHRDNGVEFYLDASVERIDADGDKRSVVLGDGTRLDCDMVVIGVGVRPATDYVDGVGTNDDGSVTVDATMKLADGVYAAGDIARFPHPKTGELIRIEHWRLANQHGRIAGFNMAGEPKDYAEVPFFWTRQFDVSVKYVGYAHEWDHIDLDGSVDEGDFVAYYLKDGQVLAACGTRGDALTHVHDRMLRGVEIR